MGEQVAARSKKKKKPEFISDPKVQETERSDG